MANPKKFLIGGAAVGLAFGIWCQRYKNDNHQPVNDKKPPSALKETVKTKSSLDYEDSVSQMKQQIEEMNRNALIEDEKMNAELAQRRIIKNAELEKQIRKMEASFKEDEEILRRKKLESDTRLENLKAQNKMDQFVKNKIASFENEMLKNQNKRELEEMERSSERSREVHLKKIAKMDDDFQRNQENFEKDEEERRHELHLQEERAQQRKREIEDQLARDLEELRRKDKKRRREMDEQLRQIHRVLQMKVWNDVIESNWTKRLNTLRSSNQDVQKAYSQMKKYTKQDESFLENQRNNILTAISNQKFIMETEKDEMDRLYNENRKEFLLEIKDAVEDVSGECDRLSYVLKNEPSNRERIDECYTALSKASMGIPTLAELKQRYKESLKQ